MLDTVRAYRMTMREFAASRNLDVWYAHLEVDAVIARYASQFHRRVVKRTEKTMAKARTRDSMSAFSKLTRRTNGRAEIMDQSPLIVPIRVLAADRSQEEMFDELDGLLQRLPAQLAVRPRGAARAVELVDFARKVVGVGSVGTRAWIALMFGRDGDDPLFLQVKEAEASVMEEFVGASEFANHGERVVTGQRLMQAASDIFLGLGAPAVRARRAGA